MNRGLVVVAGASVIVALIAILVLAEEKVEKQTLAQENSQLKNQVNNLTNEIKKTIDAKPILQKQITGFKRDFVVDNA